MLGTKADRKMKVGLHTVDLFPGRERLMPFRTVLEVARVMAVHGWQADVLNSNVSKRGASDFEWMGVRVVQCPRDFAELCRWVDGRGYDAFFFAATIREGLRDLRAFGTMKCRKVAYVPSGITTKWNALQLFRHYGIFAKAWLLEAFTPKRLVTEKLRRAGFEAIIGLTAYTSRKVGGPLPATTIYPGKDGFEHIASDPSALEVAGLHGQKFYLFTGAPGQVRGSLLLLRAFDQFAARHESERPRIVFLMRNDVGTQYDLFFKTLSGIKHKDFVTVLWQKLTIPQLKAFMEAAYAVVLPFICIPAEVPITYFEVMSCATPVVSFSNAGTTEYLKAGIKSAGRVSVDNLSKALSQLWTDERERNRLATGAVSLMAHHPTWEQVGLKWMSMIKN